MPEGRYIAYYRVSTARQGARGAQHNLSLLKQAMLKLVIFLEGKQA